MKVAIEENVKPAHLWARIKAQALGENPFVSEDEDGRTIVMCPRCEKWFRNEDLVILSVVPKVRQYCATIRKCSNCSHLWAYVE